MGPWDPCFPVHLFWCCQYIVFQQLVSLIDNWLSALEAMNFHVVFYILPIGQTCANCRALVSDTFWFGEAWVTKGLPRWCSGKEPTTNAGGARDLGSKPLQYSCLGNPIDRGTWRATVHGVAKSQTRLSNKHRQNRNRESGDHNYLG